MSEEKIRIADTMSAQEFELLVTVYEILLKIELDSNEQGKTS